MMSLQEQEPIVQWLESEKMQNESSTSYIMLVRQLSRTVKAAEEICSLAKNGNIKPRKNIEE